MRKAFLFFIALNIVFCQADTATHISQDNDSLGLGNKRDVVVQPDADIHYTSNKMKQLLHSENILTNVQAIAPGFEQKNPNYLIYLQQIKAIKQIKEEKITSFVPDLLKYIFYPAIGGVPTSQPSSEIYAGEVREDWPAFDALVQMQDFSGPALEVASQDKKNSWAMRLTYFQALYEINPERARKIGATISDEALATGQIGAARRVELVRQGGMRFWGLISFTPIKYNKLQIMDLLSPKFHIKDTIQVLIGEDNRKSKIFLNVKTAQLKPSDDYESLIKQLAAIHDAGELKFVESVPRLLIYIDYISSPSYSFSVSHFTLEYRRKKHPALDALLKIGDAALPALIEIVRDQTRATQFRLSALSVMREIDYQVANTTGQTLLQESRITDSANDKARLELILKKDRTYIDFLRPDSSGTTSAASK